MISGRDRMLLARSDWTLPEMVHLVHCMRALVAAMDALLGVRMVAVPIAPGEAMPSFPYGTDKSGIAQEPSPEVPIPRRVATALRAIDALRTRAELKLVAERLRQRLEAP